MALRRSLPGNIGAPGVYVHEVSGGSRPIVAVGTSTAGFVGQSPNSEHASTVIAGNNTTRGLFCEM